MLLSLTDYKTKEAKLQKNEQQLKQLAKLQLIFNNLKDKVKEYEKNKKENEIESIEDTLSGYIKEIQKLSLKKFTKYNTKETPKPHWKQDNIQEKRDSFEKLQQQANTIIQQLDQFNNIFEKFTYIDNSQIQPLYVQMVEQYTWLRQKKAF